jgi:hypothetical protein
VQGYPPFVIALENLNRISPYLIRFRETVFGKIQEYDILVALVIGVVRARSGRSANLRRIAVVSRYMILRYFEGILEGT